MGLVVIGTPGDRRLALLGEALARQGREAARVVSYERLLAGEVHLGEVVVAGDVVRIESPGKLWAGNRALLVAGRERAEGEGGTAWWGVVPEGAPAKGVMWPWRQWYWGLVVGMERVAGQLAEVEGARVVVEPETIIDWFDKRITQKRLQAGGVVVPLVVGDGDEGAGWTWDRLEEGMKVVGVKEVFVKVAHGSSGVGMVALRTDGKGRWRGRTTVEMVREKGEVQLYNSRRIRAYEDVGMLATLIETLAGHHLHVEAWIPKMNWQGWSSSDVRLVVMGGRVRQGVVRMSDSPMTNLHLLNERGDLGEWIEGVGEERWEMVRGAAERAVGCWPGAFYAGVDLALTEDKKRVFVLEVNAFGDLLPRVMWAGEDTYGVFVREVLGGKTSK